MTIEHHHALFASGHFYHVYNRANTSTDKLFFQEKNYTYFLKKFDQHLSDYLEVWAYCLMPNHFHFLVKIKDTIAPSMNARSVKNIDTVVLSKTIEAIKKIDIVSLSESTDEAVDLAILVENINIIKKIDTVALVKGIDAIQNSDASILSDVNAIIEEQFRKFFIGYAKAINKQESRRGSLFQKKFKRLKIDNDIYLMILIHYIHHNPVHHNLRTDFQNWRYNSYHAIVTEANTKVMIKEVLEFFGNKDRFIEYHQMLTDYNKIKRYIIE
jgi:REP element-mobilizing transposase RayT